MVAVSSGLSKSAKYSVFTSDVNSCRHSLGKALTFLFSVSSSCNNPHLVRFQSETCVSCYKTDLIIQQKGSICVGIFSGKLSDTWNNNLSLSVAKTNDFLVTVGVVPKDYIATIGDIFWIISKV